MKTLNLAIALMLGAPALASECQIYTISPTGSSYLAGKVTGTSIYSIGANGEAYLVGKIDGDQVFQIPTSGGQAYLAGQLIGDSGYSIGGNLAEKVAGNSSFSVGGNGQASLFSKSQGDCAPSDLSAASLLLLRFLSQ